MLVGALILAINFAPVPSRQRWRSGSLVARRWPRSRRSSSGSAATPNPLYDLQVAGRRVFWVAACAGIIVFGSLMGAMFIGQQFLQNVLGYSTLDAGCGDPARRSCCMVLVAPRSAKLVEAHGARFTLLLGYVVRASLGFLTMLLLWDEGSPYWQVGLAYAFMGTGVGLRRHARVALAHRLGARSPCGHGLGHRRPAARPRRRHHAVDPRRAAHRRLRGGVRRQDRRSPDADR